MQNTWEEIVYKIWDEHGWKGVIAVLAVIGILFGGFKLFYHPGMH